MGKENYFSTGGPRARQEALLKQFAPRQEVLELEKALAIPAPTKASGTTLSVSAEDIDGLRKAAAMIDEVAEAVAPEGSRTALKLQLKADELEKIASMWAEALGLEVEGADIEWAAGDVAKEGRPNRPGRWVASKVIFETRKGDKVPTGTKGRYVEHAVDGDDRVVWVLFPGFGVAAARVGKGGEAVA